MRYHNTSFISIILVSVMLSGCRNNVVEPHEVALSMASVPAQMCIALNNARNDILENVGDAIHDQAVREEWSADREREAVLELHRQDDGLRDLVAPRWCTDEEGAIIPCTTEGANEHIGRCRVVTEYLERLSEGVDEWEDTTREEWREAVSQALALINETILVVRNLGIADLYGWLDERVQIGESGLGELLRNVLIMSEGILDTNSGGE